MDTTLIEAIKNNRPYIQNQALYKGRQMSKIIKGKLDRTKKSDTSWLVTKITKIYHKTSEGYWTTSLILITDTVIRTPEQHHVSFYQYKLRCGSVG